MAHPYLRVLLETFEQRVRGVDSLKVGTSILARVGLFDLTTQGVTDELSTIADTQHWHTTYKLQQVDLESLRIVYRVGRTTQNYTNHRGIVLREFVVGHNLAEGVQLAHTAADKLRGLRTEIENNNLLCHTYINN